MKRRTTERGAAGSHTSVAALAGVLFLVAGMAPARGADVVQTLRGRLEGTVAFQEGRVAVGGKSVRWEDVLTVIKAGTSRVLSAPEAIRLRNGEVWPVDLLGMSAGQLDVRSPLFGARKIEVGRVAELGFEPCLGPERGFKPCTLYREKGEPVPGDVLWIDSARIAIDSPLGVLKLRRDNARRYVLAAPARRGAAPPTGDELRLVDGAVLHGKLRCRAGRLTLDHPLVGSLDVPGGIVAAVVRRSPAVLYLADAPFASVEAVPLITACVAPRRVERPWSQGAANGGFLAGVRIEPKATVRYRVPRRAGVSALLRAAVGPAGDSRGDLRVRIVAGGRRLFEKELSAGSGWEQVSLELPAAGDLAIEVDFGTRLRFPCALVLGDPHVVFAR